MVEAAGNGDDANFTALHVEHTRAGVALRSKRDCDDGGSADPQYRESKCSHIRSSNGYFASRSFRITFPPFITNFTRCNSEISVKGFPLTATMSAYFPFSIEPTRSSHPIA